MESIVRTEKTDITKNVRDMISAAESA